MTGVGSLTVDLIAQTASFNANISAAADKLNSNAAKMNRSLQNIESGFDRLKTGAAGLAAAFGGAALIAAGGRALDYAASLGEVSAQIGVTIKDLQVYRYTATQVGLSQEEMEKSLAKLTVTVGKAALGSKSESKAFDALGISVRDAGGHVKSASDIMPELADRLARIQDPAKRAAVEVALFGRAGQKLDPLLSQGSQGLKAMEDRAKSLGVVLSDDLAMSADEAADRMAELKMQLEANFAKTVAENAQSILGLANSIATLTGQAVRYIQEYPRLSAALAGAAAGSRFGLPGAAIGAGIGFAIANRNTMPSGDALAAAIRQNASQLDAAARTYRGKSNSYIEFLRKRRDELLAQREGAALGGLKQFDILGNPVGSAKAAPLPEFEVPEFLAGGGGRKGPKEVDTFTAAMERLKQKTEDLRAEFQSIDESWSEADIARAAIETDALRVVQENATKWTQAQKDAYMASAKELASMSDQTVWAKEKLEELSAVMENISSNPIDLGLDRQIEWGLEKIVEDVPDLRTNMQRFWDEMREMGPEAFDTITHGIEDVILGFSSMGDAIRSVVSQLASMALQAFVWKPLAAGLGLPGFASGTDFAPGGLAIVGERGPEIVNLPRGSQVIPNHRVNGIALNRAAASIDRSGRSAPLVGAMHFPSVRNAREARETMQQAQAWARRLMADNAKAGY